LIEKNGSAQHIENFGAISKKKNIPGTLGNFVNQFHTWAESVNNLLILGVLGGTSGHFSLLGGTCSVLLGGTSQQIT